jgi:hypothetical protein
MTTLILQIQKNAGQFFRDQFFSDSLLTDLKILTVQTSQGTTGKKDRSGPKAPGKRGFLSKMG